MEILKYIIGGIVGGLVGTTLTYFFGIRKDIKAKKREIITQYLINAYQVLTNETANRPQTKERTEKLENILSDIQLFGSIDQVKMAINLCQDIANKDEWELDPLIKSLRSDLRKELNLSTLDGNVHWLRFNNTEK